jgi:hypothetical protein
MYFLFCIYIACAIFFPFDAVISFALPKYLFPFSIRRLPGSYAVLFEVNC